MNEPQTNLDILKWHQEMLEKGISDARRATERQMKWYATVFALAVTIAGGLITLAGSVGYKDSIDRAVKTVNDNLGKEVQARIVRDTTEALEPTVQANISNKALAVAIQKIDAMLADGDKRYVRVNGEYLLHDGDWYLNLSTDHVRSVSTVDNGGHTFALTAK